MKDEVLKSKVTLNKDDYDYLIQTILNTPISANMQSIVDNIQHISRIKNIIDTIKNESNV